MRNEYAWNQEYKDSQLVTKSDKPQQDFLRFLKWLKKETDLDMYNNVTVLDLGCGTGRNAYYVTDTYDATAIGWDFSEHAIELGQKQFKHPKLTLTRGDIRNHFPLADNSVDVILDITTSNALSESERAHYIAEAHRVLKNGGYMYVRTLAKEGDANAKALMQQFPGKEHNTYIHPQLHVTERVFSKPDFIETYAPHFNVVEALSTTGCQVFGKQRYKRNYWNMYLSKN
jgi:SAM-dependent methyltransferase